MPVTLVYICIRIFYFMNKLRWLSILMIFTIVGITGFQAWWVKQNYDREKNTLSIKTDITFRETVRRLQGNKLKLDNILLDSMPKSRVKVFVSRGGEDQVIYQEGHSEMISTINVLRDKFKDSLKKGERIIQLDRGSFTFRTDSSAPIFNTEIPTQKENIFRFLYNVDSLQDSLKLKEIHAAYAEALTKQDIDVSFSVLRSDSGIKRNEPMSNQVTIGFVNPITYKLQLGNTFPYLLKQILSPILFSLFLVGFTILSFVLLYRNLLRQRRLAELKNDFISNITHELKTPIATVGVAIEALKNFNAIHDPQRTKEYLDISSNELQRLNLLVDKVLKLSMFEKKEIDLKFEKLNLKELADEVVSSMRLQIEKRHAEVSVSSEGDLHMQGDRLHLLSVIFNLVDNALKYSNGSPVVKISLKEKEKFVEMKIADNGIGISPEYKDKVFEKFFRVPAGDTHNAKGYGLGLSYVSHVVEKHKGTVVVESQPGAGTKFIITMPKNVL